MKKFVFTIVLILGMGHQLFADDTKPVEWTEDETNSSIQNPSESFLDETRLRCISEGYRKTTGMTPSHTYLSTLALRIRTDVPPEDQNTNSLNREVNEKPTKNFQNLRKSYLIWMAQHISMSGACTDADITDADKLKRLDYKKLTAAIIDPIIPKVVVDKETKEKSLQSPELNKLSEILIGWPYNTIQKLFPLGEKNGAKFIGLTYEGKKELLTNTYDERFKQDVGWFDKSPTNGKFLKCFEKIEDNRKNGVKNSQGKSIHPGKICRSIQDECGYSESKYFCKGLSEPTASAPATKTPGAQGSTPSDSSR